jgi:hypothetical protein
MTTEEKDKAVLELTRGFNIIPVYFSPTKDRELLCNMHKIIKETGASKSKLIKAGILLYVSRLIREEKINNGDKEYLEEELARINKIKLELEKKL